MQGFKPVGLLWTCVQGGVQPVLGRAMEGWNAPYGGNAPHRTYFNFLKVELKELLLPEQAWAEGFILHF